MSSGLRKRQTPFVQIPSATIRDKRLSFRARGILSYLLDMPPGWDVRSNVISTAGTEGREAIRSALRELGRLGYYRLERRRLLDGTCAMGTAISETPVPEWAAENARLDGKPAMVIEQEGGTFKAFRDGRLVDDGFDLPPAPDPDGGESADGESADSTGDGFSGPGFPDAGGPGDGSPDSGPLGAFSKTESSDRETEEEAFLPAVGGLTVRNAGEAADLRSGIQDPSPSPVPATASPGDTATADEGFPLIDDDPEEPEPDPEPAQPSTPTVVALFDQLPEDLRRRITAGQKGKLLAALARQLRDRTPDELGERLHRRWLWWVHTGERVNDAYAVATKLIERRQCADARCEDGTGLDSGLPCMACADSRPLRSQPAPEQPERDPFQLAPTTETRPTVAPVSSMSSSPAARSVAEALAPIPYVEPKTTTPVTQRSTPSGAPNAAVAELRARWASAGIQAPSKRPAAARVAAPRPPVVEPDPAIQAACEYLNSRGDFDIWMTAARQQLGNDADNGKVFILAAELAKAGGLKYAT